MSGQDVTLKVHVNTPDTWTAYVLSYDYGSGPVKYALTWPRVWWGANARQYGDIDRQELFDICAKHVNPDLSAPTDGTRSFTFTPLDAHAYHAAVQVLHGSCHTDYASDAQFTLSGPQVLTATLDFAIGDSGWKYDVNGPAAPGGRIDFEQSHYDDEGFPTGKSPGFQFATYDPDGTADRVFVDWGDGTGTQDVTSSRLNVRNACYGGGSFSGVLYLDSFCLYQPGHTYAVPGTYTIRFTVDSGSTTRNAQSSAVTATYHAAAPAATPSAGPSPT